MHYIAIDISLDSEGLEAWVTLWMAELLAWPARYETWKKEAAP